MFLVYDFEVFKYDWCVVIVDLMAKKRFEFVNDREGLVDFYNNHLNYVWCGFNNKNYDDYILKAILHGYNPKEMNDFIIAEDKSGWQFDGALRQYKLISYDVFLKGAGSLKKLEAFMGDDIRETEVPFDIDRPLTEEEIEQTLFYCRHDVSETIKVMAKRKEEFFAIWGLIKEFNLPVENLNKTKAQISSIILGCVSQEFDDEWDFQPEKCIRIEKYREVYDWFCSASHRYLGAKLEIDIAGAPHVFGWGGCHGAINNYIQEGEFINVDVTSFYPTLMIEWDMLSRTPQFKKKFKEIYEKRLALKREGKKAEQQPLKIVLNSTYGASGDKFNALYDPRQAHRVCMNGQLMLLDLIERCEPYALVIQSNTDGVLFQVPPENKESFMNACKEWESRTRMPLEFDDYKRVIQRDVNNYIIVPEGNPYDEKGKPRWKGKGLVLKFTSELDNDLPILNEALHNYFILGTPIEETVGNAVFLSDFQRVYTKSSLYNQVLQNATFRKEKILNPKTKRYSKKTFWNKDGSVIPYKTCRIFATKLPLGALYKRKFVEDAFGNPKNPEKFANCPDNVFIMNESVKDLTVDNVPFFDKDWYINFIKREVDKILGVKGKV